MSKRRAEAGDAVVGCNIRLHRLDRGLSQTDLARGLGVSFQQVQKYEKGVNRVGAARLVRIAVVLNVPVARLLAGIDQARRGGAASPLAMIAEREPLRLLRAYTAIGDERLRRSLRELAEVIARAALRR
jgi:transcriptional regulator with XRE-family HTH domain